MVSLWNQKTTISNFYAAVFFFFSRGFKTQWSALWVAHLALHGSSIFCFSPAAFITHTHTFICFSVSQNTLHTSLSLSVKHLTAALFWWSMASVKIQWEAVSLDHRYRDQLMKLPAQTWTLIWQVAPLIFCPLVALAGFKTTTDRPPSLWFLFYFPVGTNRDNHNQSAYSWSDKLQAWKWDRMEQ